MSHEEEQACEVATLLAALSIVETIAKHYHNRSSLEQNAYLALRGTLRFLYEEIETDNAPQEEF